MFLMWQSRARVHEWHAGAAESTQECSVGNIPNPLNENVEQNIGVEVCIKNNKLLQANGKSVNIITNVC